MEILMGGFRGSQESSLGHAKLGMPFSFPSGDGWLVEGI